MRLGEPRKESAPPLERVFMRTTDELIQKSNGIISVEPEINDWTGKHFMMFDSGAIELETGEFLYGLVRVLKPTHIFETGTFTGISAMYMAQGLKDNDIPGSELLTVEIDNTHKERAEKLWKSVSVDKYVQCKLIKSLELELSNRSFDLMFLDSEPNLRFAELVRFFPNLNPGGFVFLHDLHRHMGQNQPGNPDHPEIKNWPWGDLPQQIINWVKDDELRPIHFPTPRGLLGLYKTHPGDYKWK